MNCRRSGRHGLPMKLSIEKNQSGRNARMSSPSGRTALYPRGAWRPEDAPHASPDFDRRPHHTQTKDLRVAQNNTHVTGTTRVIRLLSKFPPIWVIYPTPNSRNLPQYVEKSNKRRC